MHKYGSPERNADFVMSKSKASLRNCGSCVWRVKNPQPSENVAAKNSNLSQNFLKIQIFSPINAHTALDVQIDFHGIFTSVSFDCRFKLSWMYFFSSFVINGSYAGDLRTRRSQNTVQTQPIIPKT